jgi:hypothetical protein
MRCASEDFQARTTTRKGTVLRQQWVWLSALSLPYPIIHSGSGWLAGAGMSFFCLCPCPFPNQTLIYFYRCTTTMAFFHMASTRAPSTVIAVNSSSPSCISKKKQSHANYAATTKIEANEFVINCKKCLERGNWGSCSPYVETYEEIQNILSCFQKSLRRYISLSCFPFSRMASRICF